MMVIKLKQRGWVDVLVFAGALFLFGWFVSAAFPHYFIAIAGLLICCAQAGMFYAARSDTWPPFFFTVKQLLASNALIAFGVAIGIAAANRDSAGLGYFPHELTSFAPVAIGIGLTEELCFRGYAYQRVESASGSVLLAVALSAFLHAGYKSILFISPYAQGQVNIALLFWPTLIAGFLLGWLRSSSRSVWPAAIAHALFDMIVYGDAATAPWWVW